MYLPRSLISKLYIHLQNSRHPLSPPVLILVALEPDALCGCRILTRLLKHDYIPHKIQPISGYADLEKAGKELVVPMMESRGGAGGLVICLGVGGMVDLGPLLGLEPEGEENPYSGVEVWVLDAHRPWNLANVFGGFPLLPSSDGVVTYQSRSPVGVSGGGIGRAYNSDRGGIVVFDDGDIEEDLMAERDAYLALVDMPELDDDANDYGLSDDDDEPSEPRALAGQKRKSLSGNDDELSDDEDRPHQRRRSNSVRKRIPSHGHGLTQRSQALSIHQDVRHSEDWCHSETRMPGCRAIQLSLHPAHRSLRCPRPAPFDENFCE